jgi:hypothetical protein
MVGKRGLRSLDYSASEAGLYVARQRDYSRDNLKRNRNVCPSWRPQITRPEINGAWGLRAEQSRCSDVFVLPLGKS